ncbi:hypothetical protein BDW22DRAFT_1429906 [Trametopsis cervina]|nr:hypothetical protein BDW22DRAFT_1429906 [Trametopsis cervina]
MAGFNVAAVILHSVAAAILTYGYNQLERLPNNDFVKNQVGGHFQFLTIQGLAVAWLTMVLSLIADVTHIQAVVRFKRALFMVAMPLAAVISSIYWTLLLFFPTLILRVPEPGELGPTSSGEVPELLRIPIGLDLSLHAVPGAALLLDFYLFEVKYASSYARYGGAAVCLIAASGYSWWAEYCASFNKIFPYPFLTNNDFPGRVGIYIAVGTFAYFVFQILNSLHS